MEFHFVSLLIFHLTFYIFQDVTSMGSVQISTCDVPTYNTSLSICCYTEHLPSYTTINFYFYNNHDHVPKTFHNFSNCQDGDSTSNLTATCVKKGNALVYSLAAPDTSLQDYEDVTFECGNGANKATTTITVLDGHITSFYLPESSPELYYKLEKGLTSSVRLYILQSNVTLLEVDQENNVTYQNDGIMFTGDILQNNFSANILKLHRQWNGTYVCEYTINRDKTIRNGNTIVVLGKPRRPKIKISSLNGTTMDVICGDVVSASEAPLFYKPQFRTTWIIPSDDDWPSGYTPYLISSNGSSAHISNIVCNKGLIPRVYIYCTVSEQSLISYRSLGLSPYIICDEDAETRGNKDIETLVNEDGETQGDKDDSSIFVVDDAGGGRTFFSKAIWMILIGTAVMVVLVAAVISVARQRRERHARTHFLSSSPDPWSYDVQQALPFIRVEGFRQNYPRNRRRPVPTEQDSWSEQAMTAIAMEESRQTTNRPAHNDRDTWSSDVQQAMTAIAMEESRQTTNRQTAPTDRDTWSGDVQRAMTAIAVEESRQHSNRPAPTDRDTWSSDVQRAMTAIAMEESSQTTNRPETNAEGPAIQHNDTRVARLENVQNTEENVFVHQNISAVSGLREAAIGATKNEGNDDQTLLKEVESLLEIQHRNLRRDVVSLRVTRENILDNLIGYYTEESLATSRIKVKFVGEEGIDCGGVTYDMFTTFWNRAQEEFFIGCEAVVPYLPPHRFIEDSKFRILGRILSHSLVVMKEFPIRMCESTIIAMIYETYDVSAESLLDDFLYFLDEHDRNLVTMAMNDYSCLTSDQTDELMTIFERYEYAIRITADNFKHHVTQLARHVLCIRPRPLLDKMRSGIPQQHMEQLWSNFHLKILDVLFLALRPSAEKVVACLKTSGFISVLSQQQTRVFGFLKDLLEEMSEPELETFLHFVTGKKSIPREKITIAFTTATGNLRLPKAHTCSNMMELPATYEDYETFRSEFKHLLASDEALKMSMA